MMKKTSAYAARSVVKELILSRAFEPAMIKPKPKNVAIANALQVEAARRHASPFKR